MRLKALLSLFAGALLALQAPVACGQYTPRPGGPGMESFPGQGTGVNSSGLGLAFVTHLDGESLLMSVDDASWVALSQNLSLRIGDRIWVTDNARLEISFPQGATAWVSYRSELDVTRLESGRGGDAVQLALVSGEASFDVEGFASPGSVFQVDIANVSVRASRAARFRVNTLPDGTAQIGVISGSLVLETPDGFVDVSGGRMAEVQADRRVLVDFLPPADEWDAWVRSRALIYDRPAASLRYLPADLTRYAHEFDTSGRWVNDSFHGHVWVPAVAPGWSPYSNGRWVWQADDYVWLAYDPWYAPFHFGRWGWRASLGWFWIVPRGRSFWSPGYVGWSIGGDEVSWVPLGRDEVYHGYGNYGPGSVNVFQSTTINLTTVYVNSRLANGVVVVRKDDFLHGRIRNRRISPSRNPFERRGASGATILGRPPVKEIRPIRETRHPRPDVEIKPQALPPVRLERASRTIRERVVAPTREKSAFRKGNAPPPLANVRHVAPPPEEREKKGKSHEKGKPPAGQRRFKRVPEPRGGDDAAPAGKSAPNERSMDEKGKPSSGEDLERGRERGGGKDR